MGSNSGPGVCKASTVLTEPSFQLLIVIIVFFSPGIRFCSFSIILCSCSMLAVHASPLFPCIGKLAFEMPPFDIALIEASLWREPMVGWREQEVKFGNTVSSSPLSGHPAWLCLSLRGHLFSQEVTLLCPCKHLLPLPF